MKETILVVDDNLETLEVIQRNLESDGYHVLTANDVPQAINNLKEFQIDLVITDIKMPGSNGFQIVKYIQNNLKNTRVLVISGYPLPQEADNIYHTYIKNFLPKPFIIDELFSAVRKVLYSKNREPRNNMLNNT